MMLHRTLSASLLATALALPAAAQSLAPFDATYHIGLIRYAPLSSCGPAQGKIYGNYGKLVISSTGNFFMQTWEMELCEGGFIIAGSVIDSGAYTITEDGAFVLDFDPSMPGVDVIALELSWDSELFLSRGPGPFQQSLMMVGVRASATAGDMTLAGDYFVAGVDVDSVAGGFVGGSVLGSIAFDGAGAWSGVFTGRSFQLGQPPAEGVAPYSGSYSVFPDGRLSTYTPGLPDGATTADGRFGFIVNAPTEPPGLSLFVRKAAAGDPVTPLALEDGWWMSTFGFDQAAGLGEVTPRGTEGLATLDPVAGSFSYTGGSGGSFSAASDGQLGLSWSAPAGESGWLAVSEDIALFTSQGATGYTGLGVLLRDWSPLQRDTSTLSLSAGGNQVLQLRATNDHAGRWYFIVGSASGSMPGTPFGGGLVPLNVDGYTLLSVANAKLPPFINTAGLLSAEGQALAAFAIPAGLAPGLAGTTLHHAAVVLDLTNPSPFLTATNPVSLTFTP